LISLDERSSYYLPLTSVEGTAYNQGIKL